MPAIHDVPATRRSFLGRRFIARLPPGLGHPRLLGVLCALLHVYQRACGSSPLVTALPSVTRRIGPRWLFLPALRNRSRGAAVPTSTASPFVPCIRSSRSRSSRMSGTAVRASWRPCPRTHRARLVSRPVSSSSAPFVASVVVLSGPLNLGPAGDRGSSGGLQQECHRVRWQVPPVFRRAHVRPDAGSGVSQPVQHLLEVLESGPRVLCTGGRRSPGATARSRWHSHRSWWSRRRRISASCVQPGHIGFLQAPGFFCDMCRMRHSLFGALSVSRCFGFASRNRRQLA